MNIWDYIYYIETAKHKWFPEFQVKIGKNYDGLVESNYTVKDLTNRYRELVKENHPDIAEDKEAASKAFQEIHDAYQSLKWHTTTKDELLHDQTLTEFRELFNRAAKLASGTGSQSKKMNAPEIRRLVNHLRESVNDIIKGLDAFCQNSEYDVSKEIVSKLREILDEKHDAIISDGRWSTSTEQVSSELLARIKELSEAIADLDSVNHRNSGGHFTHKSMDIGQLTDQVRKARNRLCEAILKASLNVRDLAVMANNRTAKPLKSSKHDMAVMNTDYLPQSLIADIDDILHSPLASCFIPQKSPKANKTRVNTREIRRALYEQRQDRIRQERDRLQSLESAKWNPEPDEMLAGSEKIIIVLHSNDSFKVLNDNLERLHRSGAIAKPLFYSDFTKCTSLLKALKRKGKLPRIENVIIGDVQGIEGLSKIVAGKHSDAEQIQSLAKHLTKNFRELEKPVIINDCFGVKIETEMFADVAHKVLNCSVDSAYDISITIKRFFQKHKLDKVNSIAR